MAAEIPFDPFQVFEVYHKHCAIIYVKIVRGRRITKGWAKDLMDTPDPYVILTLANSPNAWRKTSVKDNDINPEWLETFTFWLDPEQEHTLNMSLMDANYTVDEHLATVSLPLQPLPIDTKLKKTISFNETSEIDIEVWGEINEKADLRYSLTLCNEEKSFIDLRKRKIHKAMKTHFGFGAPKNYKEVPVIGIIGSGGGFRAMVAYSGVMSALSELGILDMATYIGGLSGSAWYLSQLYSHHNWPGIAPSEQRNELRNNIDHSFLWLFKSNGITFAKDVWKKRSRGEPVSFTDLFGHLVGNTLLKDRLECKLSDQRKTINDGQCALPLYTCLHVKKSISAMVFHEWMEFSPYEIGLPKYGTFMKAEQFSCKFFMGCIVKEFPEPPLHFLLVDSKSSKLQNFENFIFRDAIFGFVAIQHNLYSLGVSFIIHGYCAITIDKLVKKFGNRIVASGLNKNIDLIRGRNIFFVCGIAEIDKSIWGSAFCIQFKRLLQDDKNVDPVELMRREREELEEELRKDMENCDIEESESSDDENINEKGMHGEKTTGGLQRKRSKSTKLKQKSFWDSMLSRMMETRWFQSIELRAAQIFNFMRGLSLNNVFPFSPFTKTQEEENENTKSTFGGIFDLHPTHIKKLYVVDSGLTFNSPYPVLLRPQREVDIILSFDFSARASDDTPPFKELLLAAKWAELNKVPFPPIDTSVIEKEGLKECYVFKHPWDPNCPIVLHFCLVNINFKREVRPGISRKTQKELDFANFSIFDDPARPYSTFKFTYTHLEFDRLSKLMEYNTLFCQDIIFDNIATCIKRRKRFSIRRPCKKKDIARLSLNNKIKADKLAEYISMVEQVSGLNENDDCDKFLRNDAGNLPEDKLDSNAELRENYEMKHRPFSLPLRLPEDDRSSNDQKESSRRMRLTSDMSKLDEETEELDISPSKEISSHLGTGKGILSRSRLLAKSPKKKNIFNPNGKETSNDVCHGSNNDLCYIDQSDSVFENSSLSRILRKTVSSTAELNASGKTSDESITSKKHFGMSINKQEAGINPSESNLKPSESIYDSLSDNSYHPLVDWINSADRVTHL